MHHRLCAVAGAAHGPAHRSLVELLAERRSSITGYVTVDSLGAARSLTFEQLYQRSGRLGAALAETATPGSSQHVVVAIDDPLGFIVAFFASMRAGLIPVPSPAPTGGHPARSRRFEGIVSACRPCAVLTRSSDLDGAADVDGPDRGSEPDDAAYVQFTSGSTSEPKPVVLSHERVCAQLGQAAAAYAESADCVSVNWVPLYHDMGLVTSVLRPLYSGYTSVLLDNGAFVKRPRHWLEQLSEWHATHTSAPDFGYALCVSRFDGSAGLDLSALRVARSAGEPVRARTIDEFSQMYAMAGFRRRAFCPSYGLAEATLTVTTSGPGQDPRFVAVSRAALRHNRATDPRDTADMAALVSCGAPLAGTTVRILDQDGRPCAHSDEVGEVWISGPQVAPDPDHPLDGTSGLRTGDFGFLHDGELVLIGRSAERFQIRGVNYYSNDIEHAMAGIDPRLRSGRAAAFPVVMGDEERTELVVLAELRADAQITADEWCELSAAVTQRVAMEIGVTARRVVLVPARTLPVTSSGKVRRDACRAMYESHALPSPPIHAPGTGARDVAAATSARTGAGR